MTSLKPTRGRVDGKNWSVLAAGMCGNASMPARPQSAGMCDPIGGSPFLRIPTGSKPADQKTHPDHWIAPLVASAPAAQGLLFFRRTRTWLSPLADLKGATCRPKHGAPYQRRRKSLTRAGR